MPRDMSLESPSPLDREPPANLPARFVAKEAAVSEATKIYTDYHMMGPLSGYTQEQAEAAWAQVQSQHLGSMPGPLRLCAQRLACPMSIKTMLIGRGRSCAVCGAGEPCLTNGAGPTPRNLHSRVRAGSPLWSTFPI
jgi:hypothetical protein